MEPGSGTSLDHEFHKIHEGRVLEWRFPSCCVPDEICHRGFWYRKSVVVPVGYAGGVEAGSRGAKQPRVKEAQGGINPGKGCSLPNLRTAFGVRIPIQHAIPRVRASHDPGLSAETPPA